MSNNDITTISVKKETWQKLHSEKESPGDSFNDVVERLLDE
jgi:predicted CopG family antitoxin